MGRDRTNETVAQTLKRHSEEIAELKALVAKLMADRESKKHYAQSSQ